jgi:hypothetical protein
LVERWNSGGDVGIWHDLVMATHEHDTEPAAGDDAAPEGLDLAKLANDPGALKEAHKKYGDYLKKVGLPFEPEEFDESAEQDEDADGDGDPQAPADA